MVPRPCASRLPAALVVLMAAGATSCNAAAQEGSEKDYGGIQPTVVAAWEKAGAKFVWFDKSRQYAVRSTKPKDGGNALPGFGFFRGAPSEFSALPAPGVPFGLIVSQVISDENIKGLGGLRQLVTLIMIGTGVTDAGLKELAGLRRVLALHL